MQEDFKVSITGDVSGLKKAVGDAEKELSAFASKSRELKNAINENIAIAQSYNESMVKLGKAFRNGEISQAQFKESLSKLKKEELDVISTNKKLQLSLAELNKQQLNLSKNTPQVGTALNGVNKSGADATYTMMEFSKVVQYAPDGIRGVVDNVSQLVGEFGSLQKSSGGANEAMKAIASSLLSPTGILVIISLVTTLLIKYGDQLANIGSQSSKLAKENEELAKSFGTSQSVLEAEIGALDAQLEIMKLQKVSTKELLALKLKLLTASQSDLVNQQFALESQLKNTKAVALEYSLWQKIVNLSLQSRGMAPLPALIDNDEKEKLKEIELGIANVKQRIQETILEIGKITAPEIFDPEKIKEEADKIKPIRLPATLDIKFEGQRGLNETEQLLKDKYGRPIPSDQFKLLDNLPIHVGEINSQIAYLLNDLSKTLPNGLFADLTKMSLEQLQAFAANFEKTAQYIQVVERGIEMAASDMAYALGKSLAEGDNIFEALGSSLLGSLGAILIQMGEMAIAIGIGLTAIKSALASLSPILAIGAGVALIAMGSFFAAKSAEIGSFAGGGIVGGGSFNGDKIPAFVNSGEMILNAGQQSNLFDILDGNLRKLGGQSQMQTINVQGELRGQTMLLQNKRSEKNSNRFYGRK